ncbi:MAG: hypothetical protein JNN20_13790 [Betaproteobacteria bacterium]|nr:hypothetical protein [Betaproteobacteria bacterium]
MQTSEFMSELGSRHSSWSAALARPRPIARSRVRHPVAVCNRCAAFSFHTAVVNERCERIAHGRECPGVMKRSADGSEWQACVACDGTGWHLGMVCMHCQSLGWRFSRKY